MNRSPSAGLTDHVGGRRGRRRAGAWAWLLGVPALALLATTAAVCGDGSGRTPLSIAGATGTPTADATPAAVTPTPAAGMAVGTATPAATAETAQPLGTPTVHPASHTTELGDSPPSMSSRELPGDMTGGTTWWEITWVDTISRLPSGSDWRVSASDAGSEGRGFGGLPVYWVTHLPTGQARFYSLVDGTLLLCSDRTSALAAPDKTLLTRMQDQGTPVDCNAQPLTAQEREVFDHILITGSYSRYRGPIPGEPTYPGIVVPTARPNPHITPLAAATSTP